MNANAAFLAQQIGIIQAATRLAFDPDPTINIAINTQVANLLAASGVQDVRNLRYVYNDAADLSFFYDITTGTVLQGTPTGTESDAGDPTVPNWIDQYQTHTVNYFIYLVFTKDGYPVFFARARKRANDWQDALKAIVSIAGIAISVAFPALAGTIGNAILGADTAAAYPAVANALGSVVINTSLNGGDVQAATISALSGGVGSGVGDAVASASDSAIIGKVAGSVAKAAITGGDLKTAATNALISSGVSSVGALPSFSGGDMQLGQLGDDYGGDSDPTSSDVSALYSDAGYGDTSTASATTGYHDPVYASDGTPEGDTLTIPPAATQPPTGPGGAIATANGASLTALAIQALNTITAFRNAGNPAIRTSNASVVANPNGTLTNANGTITQMAAGVPYLCSNGSLVTNNGNGTYTTVAPSGTVTTSPYPAGSTGTGLLGSMSPAVLIGAGLLLFLAMK